MTNRSPVAARIAATISAGVARALGERSAAVLVFAPIRLGPQKLVEQIAVRGMHLDAVCADLLRMLGRPHVGVLQLLADPSRVIARPLGRPAWISPEGLNAG